VAVSCSIWYYLFMDTTKLIEDLVRDEASEDTYLTHYETDCFCVGECACEETDLDEDEMEAAVAAAEAAYDQWRNA
jgi:hypothetical protein